MLKKLTKMNYFVALVILSGTILILGLAAVILVASFPNALAKAPTHYQATEIYEFEPWSFEINGLDVSYPEGGIIIPLFLEDKQEAALLIGTGISRSGEHPLPLEDPMGLFLKIHQDTFLEIRGDTIFVPVKDEATRDLALNVYNKQLGLPVQWQRWIPLSFQIGAETVYYYFLDPAGFPVLPPTIIEQAKNVYGAIALYTLFIAAVLLLVLIFSLDHHPSRYWKFIYCARPKWPAVAATAVAAGFALLGEALPSLTGLRETGLVFGYAAAIGTLILLAKLKQIDFLDFGIRSDTLKHGYLIAVAVAALYMLMFRGVPGKPAPNGVFIIMEFLPLFFLIAPARELIWRGYIQATLGRLLGQSCGVIATVILAGLVHAAALAITDPWLLAYPYTVVETMVLAPGTALVLGFIYLRTENIFCCTLLHSLILLLPRVMAG